LTKLKDLILLILDLKIFLSKIKDMGEGTTSGISIGKSDLEKKMDPLTFRVRTLLLLQKDLREAYRTKKEEMILNAEKVVKALPIELTDRELDGAVKRLHFDMYNTFGVISIDISSFQRDINDIRRESLDETLLRLFENEDITAYAFAQNLELLKESLIVSGYLERMTLEAINHEKKMPLGNFWKRFFNYIRKKVEIEQKNSYLVCYRLLQSAEKEGKEVTDIKINLRPLLGYNVDKGITDDYSEFRKRLNETSEAYLKLGMDLASRKLRYMKMIDKPPMGIV